MKASEPELKVQERVSLCSVAERIGLAVSASMLSRSLSEGAVGSVRSEVPETTSAEAVETISVRSRSETVTVPEVERATLVSSKAAVLMLPEAMVMAGASLVPVTLIVMVWSVVAPALSVARMV